MAISKNRTQEQVPKRTGQMYRPVGGQQVGLDIMLSSSLCKFVAKPCKEAHKIFSEQKVGVPSVSRYHVEPNTTNQDILAI